MAKEKGKFTVADLNSAMNKNSKFGGLLSDGHGVSKITEHISTGNYMLNSCVSGSLFKGIPNNRCICLSGETGVGKTYLILNMCREAQKMGYFVVFYDSENAVDDELAESFGIDLSMLRYEPVQTVQEFRSNATSFVDLLIEKKMAGMEIPKVFIALDSVGNLATQKEIDDAKAYSDKSDMSRAKVIKSIFRILMSKLGIVQGSFVFSNHIYKTLDLFSQHRQGGGCLVPGSLVLMCDGEYKPIEDIVVGDKVATLSGEKEILKTWEFEKPTVTVEFDDGSVVECSEDHRFFIGDENSNILDDSNWVAAKDLVEGFEITCVNRCVDNGLKKLKVVSVKGNLSTKVHDLTVADVQHYITDNGVINHNSGVTYGASLIVNLTKAKLKDGANQTGIIVTATPDKNRFCRPTTVRFHISYDHGMNPYVGLEEHMSWDVCGVQRGKFITKKEYDKLSADQKEACRQHPLDGDVYFQPNDAARGICTKHSAEAFKVNEIWTKKVWTDERLAELDAYLIPLIAYSKTGDDEIIEMIKESDAQMAEDAGGDELFDR